VIFTPIDIHGAFLVSMERHGDERGWFARAWCEDEFREHGIDIRLAQTNVSFNVRRGTIRGLHWQPAPHLEAKLLRCTAGEVFDVIADVRTSSPSFRAWQGFELRAGDEQLVFVPAGCAHGYQSLVDGSEVTYSTSYRYTPGAERGLRWDDPTFDIRWPVAEVIASEKDSSWPDFVPEARS
jgi:dTDP-4-dehydrorhamnose 3,5-epimerase